MASSSFGAKTRCEPTSDNRPLTTDNQSRAVSSRFGAPALDVRASGVARHRHRIDRCLERAHRLVACSFCCQYASERVEDQVAVGATPRYRLSRQRLRLIQTMVLIQQPGEI